MSEGDTQSVVAKPLDYAGTEVPLTYCGGGSAASHLLPPGFQPLAYQNTWDPRLIQTAADNMRHAATLGLPHLMPERVQPGKVAIVGSGPSVLENLEKIREIAADPRNGVFVVNYAHPLLKKHNIRISGACLFEIEARAYDCLEDPSPGCTYYICSICDPSTFAKLEGQTRVIWHCMSDQPSHKEALQAFKGHLHIGGGFTTFLRTLNVAYVLGWRDYELFGVESSFPGKDSHFFGTPNYGGDVMPITIGFADGSRADFMSKSYLVRQADEFRQFTEIHGHLFKMKVHGEGLLPLIHRKMQPQFYFDDPYTVKYEVFYNMEQELARLRTDNAELHKAHELWIQSQLRNMSEISPSSEPTKTSLPSSTKERSSTKLNRGSTGRRTTTRSTSSRSSIRANRSTSMTSR